MNSQASARYTIEALRAGVPQSRCSQRPRLLSSRGERLLRPTSRISVGSVTSDRQPRGIEPPRFSGVFLTMLSAVTYWAAPEHD
jgi:hypothetical protein